MADAKEKKVPTFITVCMDGGQTKAGAQKRNVVNLFFSGEGPKGGKDKNGNPVFSNKEEKLVGFIGDKGRLSVYKTDAEGKMVMDGDKLEKAVFSASLDRFVKGYAAGLDAKGLAVGQGTINGPKAKELVKSFQKCLDAKAAAKAAPAPAA